MLVLRHNKLSSRDLITCERTMLKFIEGKLPHTGMDFRVWDWSTPELYGIVLGMLAKLDLAGTLNICKSEMLDFVIDVKKGYFETSYHSFYHAVDVVAVLYYMLTGLGALQYLTPLEGVALLIAGLCHDIGHPGLNNTYQVNAKTELAARYSDQSVLENHSCTLMMDLLTKHKLLRNVYKDNDYYGMTQKEADRAFRDLIEKTILATDMTFHFDLLESLNIMIEQITSPCSSEDSGEEMDINSCCSESSSAPSSPECSSPSPKSFPRFNIMMRSPRESMGPLDTDQRELLCKVLIHAADLSNTVRPWEISKQWSDLVVEEFFNQGDLEKENGLPVSPNMDREQAHQSQISLGFGDFVVKPYFEAFAAFLQPANIFLDILGENRYRWGAMKNEPKTEIPVVSTQPEAAKAKVKKPVTIVTPATPNITLTPEAASAHGRRVSLAAGLLIIPDDIQEKLRSMTGPRSPRRQRLKRSLSGRSYSHHALLLPLHGLSDEDDDNVMDDHNRKPTRRKSAGPPNSMQMAKLSMMLTPTESPTSTSTSPATTPVDLRSPVQSQNTSPLSSPQPSPSPPLSPQSSLPPPQSLKRESHQCLKQGHQQRRLGRMRRSSSLDHNMIKEITAMTGNANSPEQRVIIAG